VCFFPVGRVPIQGGVPVVEQQRQVTGFGSESKMVSVLPINLWANFSASLLTLSCLFAVSNRPSSPLTRSSGVSPFCIWWRSLGLQRLG
jgi:hypothetical protein